MCPVCDWSSKPVSILFPHQCPVGPVPPNDINHRFGWQPCIQMIPIHLRTGSQHKKAQTIWTTNTVGMCERVISTVVSNNERIHAPLHQDFARLDEPVCAASNDACRHCCVPLWFGNRLIPECRTKTAIRSMHVTWKMKKQVDNPAMISSETSGAIGAMELRDRQP